MPNPDRQPDSPPHLWGGGRGGVPLTGLLLLAVSLYTVLNIAAILALWTIELAHQSLRAGVIRTRSAATMLLWD